MKEVEYEDGRGRKFLVRLDDDDPIEDAPDGIPIGPPDIIDSEPLAHLPEGVKVAIHNQLFHRKLWNLKEVNKRPKGLQGALMAALSIDAQTLHQAYAEYEKEPEIT